MRGERGSAVRTTRHNGGYSRPDALVAVPEGLQWACRGWPGRGEGGSGLANRPGPDDSTRMATVWESGPKCGGGGEKAGSLCVHHSSTLIHIIIIMEVLGKRQLNALLMLMLTQCKCRTTSSLITKKHTFCPAVKMCHITKDTIKVFCLCVYFMVDLLGTDIMYSTSI